MKTAIVTGATGFIGSRLIAALVRRGVSVTAISRRTSGPWPGVIRVVAQDSDLTALIADTNPNVVFHLAGVSEEAAARKDPALALEVNGRAVWQLMDAVHQSGRRPAVVLASSIAVYGENRGAPASETDRLLGEGPYELSKIAGECGARAFAALGLATRIARIGNVYGPADRKVGRLIPDTLEAIRTNRAPVLRAPNSLRSHLHVEDCVRGLIALGSERGLALDGRAVNICDEHGITNLDLVQLLLAQAGRDDLHPDLSNSGQAASVRLASAAFARQALGWQPEITLEQGLGDLLERSAA